MKRQPPKPVPWDLDWRNPDMKVLRPWESQFGEHFIRAVPPEEEQIFRQDMMRLSQMPLYDKDDTYTMRKYKPKTYLRKKKTP
jgi:hypothetical protein